MTLIVPNLDDHDCSVAITVLHANAHWSAKIDVRFHITGETLSARGHTRDEAENAALSAAVEWFERRRVLGFEATNRQRGTLHDLREFISRRRLAPAPPTPEEPMAKKKLSIPVEFGNVNFGLDVVRVGVKISRDALEIGVADEALCGRRLKGRIIRLRDGEAENQKPLAGMEGERHEISGMFDVKSFNVKPKMISTGLTFQLEGIEVEELVHFSKQSGRLIIDAIEDLPEPEAKKDDEDQEQGDDE